jgi:HK97 family phage prohead protease
MTLIRKNITHSVQDVSEKEGIVKFAFAHFGSLDSDGDIIEKGAYQKTVAESGPSGKDRIYHYKNHDPSVVVGKPREIYQEGDYMVMVSQLSKNAAGRDTLIEYQEGIIKEHSQGFYIMKDEQVEKARVIKEVKMVEASSLTMWAANENTPVLDLKNATENIEKLLKVGRLSDEYLSELERLHFLIKNHLEPLQHSKPETKADEEDYDLSSLFLRVKIV